MAVSTVESEHRAPKVFLVHGIDDRGFVFRRLERSLRADGYDPILISYSPNTGRVPLDALAKQVGQQISGLLKRDEPFAVVAFSMGGLVTRWWLQELEPNIRPALFITASSPHHGTLTAYARFNPGARQMRPGSSFLKCLDHGLERLQSVRLVTLRTPWDLMILPSASSILPGAENHCIPVIAHPFMLMDGRSIRLIHSLLDETFASAQK